MRILWPVFVFAWRKYLPRQISRCQEPPKRTELQNGINADNIEAALACARTKLQDVDDAFWRKS